MSLVSDYVIMTDGNWYKNATIYDESHNWFLCFDDEDPPEIVIYNPDEISSNKQKIIRVREVLKKANIYAKISQVHTTGNRLYPPDWEKGKFRPSISAFLTIRRRIDISKLLIINDGVFESRVPPHDCVFYDFDRK